MTRKKAIRMLRTQKEITCLDLASFVLLSSLAIEIGWKDLTKPVAKVKLSETVYKRKVPNDEL